MKSTITVRDINPEDKACLKREESYFRVSTEEFGRPLIRDKRANAQRRTMPSEVFERYFGPDNGFDFPPPERYNYNTAQFVRDSKT